MHFDRLLHLGGRLLHVDLAVGREGDDLGRVHEREAQVLGHQARSEILAAAHDELGRVVAGDRSMMEAAEFLADRIRKPEVAGDFAETLAHRAQKVVAGDAVLQVRVRQIQKVGDLGIARVALADGRDHDELARGVGFDDALDFLELACGADARTAELRNLNHALTSFRVARRLRAGMLC